MTRFLKRHTPVIAALLVLVLGGSVAAMAAGGTSHPGPARHHPHARSTRGWKLTQSAAAYIGVSTEALENDLRSGKSLGQVATESGKSEAGLVQALATISKAGLEERIALAIKQPGGIHGRHARHKLRLLAAGYLGVTPAALTAQLKSGATLGQLADASQGHSRAGLIDALVSARRAQSAKPGAKHSSSKGVSASRTARLRTHIARFVDHAHTGASPRKPGA